MGHELVCMDWCFSILRLLVHRVVHGLVSDANCIEELSVEGSLLQDEVGVSELPVQNELICEHEDTARGAGNYVWHFIKDNGEESSQFLDARESNNDFLELLEALKVTC